VSAQKFRSSLAEGSMTCEGSWFMASTVLYLTLDPSSGLAPGNFPV